MFIVLDTTSIYNLEFEEEPPSVFVDWACEALIVDYNTILGIDVDVLNRKKIKLYPTSEDGKVNRRISKTYYLD